MAIGAEEVNMTKGVFVGGRIERFVSYDNSDSRQSVYIYLINL